MSILVMFHLMHEKIIFSSVRVAEWPPFGKELLTLFVILVIPRVGFEGSDCASSCISYLS